jgi:type IV secretion system protein VirB6
MVMEVLITGYVLYRVLLEVSGVASALAGGISMQALSLGQLMSAAAAPWNAARSAGGAARNFVDPMTTRRDMQSGMMTTARRSNHLVAGNTIANPAYRQHVMQNLTRNWGRRKGGKITK